MESRQMWKPRRPADRPKSQQRKDILDSPTIMAFNNIVNDKRFIRHKLLLEKVSKYIQETRGNDKKWANKCRELTAEMAANASKVEAALALSEQDKATIESLKKEIENSWKLVEEAYHSEKRAREIIQTLKQELAKAAEEVKRDEATDGFANPKKLIKMNEELTLEKEGLIEKLTALENESANIKETQKKIDEEKSELNERIDQYSRDAQLNLIKYEKEKNRKNRVEKELLIVRSSLEKMINSSREQEERLERSRENEISLSKLLEQKTRDLEKALQELEQLTVAMKSVYQEFDIQTVSLKEVTADCRNRARDLKIKEEKISALKKEFSVLKKQYHTILDKFNASRSLGSETDLATLRAENEALLRQHDQLHHQCEDLGKQLTEIRDEKDKMAEAVIKSLEDVQNMQSQLLTQEHLRHSLNTQMKTLENAVKVQARTVAYLEKERDRSAAQVGELLAKVDFLQEELKAQECLNYPKQLAEADQKIVNAVKLMEESRKERNGYEKKCKEAFDEVEQMKGMIERQEQQIFYLKEQVTQQNISLKKNAETLEISYRDTHQVASTLKKRGDEHKITVLQKKRLEERNGLLTRQLCGTNKEKELLQEKLEKVFKEKHILNTQLVRRNEEIKLLHEKLEVQERTLNKGEMQHMQLEQDNSLLKTHVKSLVRTKTLMGRQVSSALKLRNELLHVHKDFIVEQTRARALEEELQSPLNIHRWRILQGTDPERYGMLLKIHALQRQLIAKTEELVQQSVEIKSKDRLLEEMKEYVSRLPRLDVLDKLQTCISQLSKKDKTLKTMESQVKMYEAYIADYQCEIERLKRNESANRSRSGRRSMLR